MDDFGSRGDEDNVRRKLGVFAINQAHKVPAILLVVDNHFVSVKSVDGLHFLSAMKFDFLRF